MGSSSASSECQPTPPARSGTPERDEAIDNGISVAPDGEIYVVTSKYMRKLVWNGSDLSDDEADGAWEEPYEDVPNPRSL